MKLSASKVWFSSRNTGEPPCLSGRPMRLKPNPSQVPESSARNPRSAVTCGRLRPLRIDGIRGMRRISFICIFICMCCRGSEGLSMEICESEAKFHVPYSVIHYNPVASATSS